MTAFSLVQPEEIEVGETKLSVSQLVMAQLQQLQFPMPQRPTFGYQGVLPTDVQSLHDDQLGDLLGQISAWCGYIEEMLPQFAMQRDEAASKLEFIQARIRLGIKAQQSTLVGNKRPTDKDKNDMVLTDPRVVDATRNLLYFEAMHSYTKALLNRSQRDWETVSRRITQRGQDVERQKRASGLDGQGPMGNVPVSAHRFRR
jgi:hypothetical protein